MTWQSEDDVAEGEDAAEGGDAAARLQIARHGGCQLLRIARHLVVQIDGGRVLRVGVRTWIRPDMIRHIRYDTIRCDEIR